MPDGAYGDGKVAEKTINDLGRLKKDGKPFFLACGFIRPHLPFYAPKKYWDLYKREDMLLADNRYRPKGAPRELRGSGEFRSYHLAGLDEKSDAFHRVMRHGYLASVSYVDQLVGNVLAELNRLELANNTIVVVWGDHGWHLGEHDFWGKHNTMHLSTRVPLIVTVPGKKGGSSTALVETSDLFPTLCELAGLSVPDTVQGRSFVTLFDQPEQAFRENAYSRFGPGDAVITDRYGYTSYKGGQSEMLYDLEKDPDENENVVKKPAYAATVKDMRRMLEERKREAAGAKVDAGIRTASVQEGEPGGRQESPKGSTVTGKARPLRDRVGTHAPETLRVTVQGRLPRSTGPADEQVATGDKAPNYEGDVPVPTHSGVAYGKHERHILDFWQAKSDKPTPLVLVIHCGGWNGGSKERLSRFADARALLDAGISVAANNYRLTRHSEGVVPPVKAPLYDSARTVQFLRSKAKEWNIDTSRIGLAGGSAGACSSLWIAYHDDLADSDSDDPVARESTRVACIAVRGPQTTLDPQQMVEWTPNSKYGGHAFGKKGFAEFLASRESILPWIEEYSPYAQASAGDPPVALFYGAAPGMGKEQKDPTHTSNFGIGLQRRCKELGLGCEVVYEDATDIKHATPTEYLVEMLTRGRM